MLTRISTHTIAVALTVLALSTFAPQLPPTPSWVTAYCADASPCPSAVTKYEGLAIAIQYTMPDPDDAAAPWIECPLLAGQHPQTGCVGGTDIAYWVLKTEGDVAHGGAAVLHQVDVFTDSPIYSTGNGMPAWPQEMHGLGLVTLLELSPTASAAQAPQFPPSAPSPADTQTWFELAYPECVANGVCQTSSAMTPAEFQTMLDASSYGSFADPVTGHTHNRPDLTLTRAQSLDGVTIPLSPTGPPR